MQPITFVSKEITTDVMRAEIRWGVEASQKVADLDSDQRRLS